MRKINPDKIGVKTQTLKGFRDFLPKEAKKRQWLINTLISVFESYGFEPLETPALEYEEILLGKYGDEGDKLMYRFEDLGKRKVALRYDQTVPLTRVVAQYQNDLPMPFKRYQIQNVWRAENTQKGRYREFLQVDVDIVGSSSPLAEAEILSMVYKSYESLGLDIQILINDRRQLSDIENKYLSSIDKVGKIEAEEVIKEMESKGMSIGEAKKTFDEVLKMQEKEPETIKEIKRIFKILNIPEEVLQYRSMLVRGLDYYTGLIFEVILKNQTKLFSLGGGGRYDNLIGMFAGRQIPAVGFGLGFDRTIEVLEENNLLPSQESSSKVLITIFNKDLKEKSLEVYSFLRNVNANCEIYLDENAPFPKQLKYADKKGIPYVLIIGPEEIENNTVTLKNMKTGEQKRIVIEKIKEATTI